MLELTTFLNKFEGKIKSSFPYHLSGGNEKQLIKIFKDYKDGDWIFSTHRSHYHWLLSARNPEILKDKILKGDSMHIFDTRFFTSSIVAGIFPIAVGVALALELKGSLSKVWCFAGDMAFGCGLATESIRYAHNFVLPITFINEDNGMSVNVKTEEVWGKVIHYKYERKYPHSSGLHKEIYKDSKYHRTLTLMMELLGFQGALFLGQNAIQGNFGGTLKTIPLYKRTELPVAEELQMGMSIGLSLEGFLPVSLYPSIDFLPRAADQIVNHLNLIKKLSKGIHKPKVIIRTTIGKKRSGLQHNKDLSLAFKKLCAFPVKVLETPKQIVKAYVQAIKSEESSLLIEKQELYE